MTDKLIITPRQRRERIRYSKRRKQRFLITLADTCDIDEACAAADLDWIGICQLQAMDPQFKADWDAVIAAHYARLETIVLKEAGVGCGGAINVTLARDLLKQRGSAAGVRKAETVPKPPPRIDRDRMVADFMRHFPDPGPPAQTKDDHVSERMEGNASPAFGGRPGGLRPAHAATG